MCVRVCMVGCSDTFKIEARPPAAVPCPPRPQLMPPGWLSNSGWPHPHTSHSPAQAHVCRSRCLNACACVFIWGEFIKHTCRLCSAVHRDIKAGSGSLSYARRRAVLLHTLSDTAGHTAAATHWEDAVEAREAVAHPLLPHSQVPEARRACNQVAGWWWWCGGGDGKKASTNYAGVCNQVVVWRWWYGGGGGMVAVKGSRSR